MNNLAELPKSQFPLSVARHPSKCSYQPVLKHILKFNLFYVDTFKIFKLHWMYVYCNIYCTQWHLFTQQLSLLLSSYIYLVQTLLRLLKNSIKSEHFQLRSWHPSSCALSVELLLSSSVICWNMLEMISSAVSTGHL